MRKCKLQNVVTLMVSVTVMGVMRGVVMVDSFVQLMDLYKLQKEEVLYAQLILQDRLALF